MENFERHSPSFVYKWGILELGRITLVLYMVPQNIAKELSDVT
jgi:hypothetical protein